jgi:hypothetical protein
MHEVTLLAPERARLPDGREFSGQNATGNAARALIADGVDPAEPMVTRWADGRPSMAGTVHAFALWRYSDDGRSAWSPHPKAEVPQKLLAWQQKTAAAREAARVVAAERKRALKP